MSKLGAVRLMAGGWALAGSDGMLKTKDYRAECLGCHIPAKATDWSYVEGYPLLR